MEQAECVAAAACPELKCSTNGRTAIMPSTVASPCCQRSVRNSLVPSRAKACDAPRHGGTTSLPSGIGCAAVLLGPRLCSASAGTSSRRERRHSLPTNKRLMDVLLPTLRQTGTRPADHKQPFTSVVPSLPHTEEAGPPRPPPEPPPGVSTAPPRRMTSSGSMSPCPSCSSVFSSIHNMKAHARRTNPGTPIVAEGLTCGFCDSSTVFPTNASRAGHYQKCQAYQRAKDGQRTSASSNDSRSPSATPLLQPHQPLSPRQSTGSPAAHAVGMPPSSTTEHPTIWEHTLSHDSTVQDGKTGRIATDSPQAINEQWLQSITKQIFPFSQHRKTSPSHSQLPPMNSLRTTALSCNTSWYHPGPLSTHRCGWAPIHSSQ
ncbi:hypothetical protein ECC02_008254 [Trypanosoma cruzi]|uniref:Uncharacterized protein n=1 Tax=Trypanosoma cruzi TaxID=5693 RepID=A0A7J6XWI0_TRYCR|nr:hypothetical protein ECC02_008254 [Trypanosoma cruzi]